MKRVFAWLTALILALTLAACSDGGSTKPAETAQPAAEAVKPAAESSASTPAADAGKTEAPSSDAGTTAQTEAKPAETPKTEGQPEAKPAEAPKAESKPAETPKAESQPAAKPAETPKAESKPAAQPAAKPAETPKAEAPAAKPAPAPAPAQAPEISAKGKKVLFVGRERNPAEDVAVAQRLKNLGFVVTNIEDRDVTIDEVKGYDLIYISQTTNSKYLKDGFMKEVAIPTVYVKNHGMYYLGLSSVEENTTVMNSKSIEIVDSKHKVAGGLSGKVDVFKEAGDKFGVSYGVPGKEAKIIATVPGDKKKAALYYYDKGTKADNGYTTKARVSFFYWSNGMHENSTDASWKLLDNLVLWTLQNG
ncbi:hypothetical protein J2T17_002658 [Paenibacillus mucilaginosus]|uniref:hypothetical protein n=1 Tax=Paenibacillus mucilaginosus TaxID=61624 RepID=UPI003D2117DD